MSSKIILHEESDAELAAAARDTWVSAKNFSVCIVKTDEGIVVDIFAKGCEDLNSIASTYAFDSEAKELIDEALGPAEDEDD